MSYLSRSIEQVWTGKFCEMLGILIPMQIINIKTSYVNTKCYGLSISLLIKTKNHIEKYAKARKKNVDEFS